MVIFMVLALIVAVLCVALAHKTSKPDEYEQVKQALSDYNYRLQVLGYPVDYQGTIDLRLANYFGSNAGWEQFIINHNQYPQTREYLYNRCMQLEITRLMTHA
jgi:hypothetical protein